MACGKKPVKQEPIIESTGPLQQGPVIKPTDPLLLSHRTIRTVRFILSLVGWGLLFSGCAPVYYVPNTHNVPLLQKKGEGVFSLATEASGTPIFPTIEGRELQGAYAITDRFALMLNMASFEAGEDERGDGGKGRLLEFGLGYYWPFLKNAVFETFGLVGGGDVENHFDHSPSTLFGHPTTTGTIESKLFRYGIQSAIGFKTKYLDLAASARIARLNYSDISGNLITLQEDQVQYLNRENSHLLVEQAITMRVGYDFIKLQIQVGKSKNLSNPNFRQEKGHLSVGIGYHLDK